MQPIWHWLPPSSQGSHHGAAKLSEDVTWHLHCVHPGSFSQTDLSLSMQINARHFKCLSFSQKTRVLYTHVGKAAVGTEVACACVEANVRNSKV